MNIRKNFLLNFFSQQLILAVLQRAVGPLIPSISRELNIGKDLIGLSLSLGMLAALIASFASIYFIAKVGLKNTIYFGLLLNFTGSIILFFLPSYAMFTFSYFILQFGYSIAFLCIINIIGNTFKNNKVHALLKVDSGYFAGLTIAPLIISLFFFIKADWHYLFLWMLIPQAALIISIFFLEIPQKNKILQNSESNIIAKSPIVDASFKRFKPYLKFICNPILVYCCLIIFLNAAILNTFYDWFTTYFENINKNISVNLLFLAAYSLSILVGLQLKTKLTAHFKSKKILLFNSIFSFVFLAGIFFIHIITFKIVFIFLLGFSLSGNFDLASSIALEYFDGKSDSISGFLVASIYFGIIIFQYLDGLFTENFSTESMLYINFILSFIMLVLVAVFNFNRRLTVDK